MKWTWLGTATGMGGALALAANGGADWVVVGYWLFLVSSLIWGIVAASRRDRPLLLMQSTFTAINLFGLLRWSA